MDELTRTLLYICAGKGSTVCSSLHCGTRYLIAILARPTTRVPRWAGNVFGGPGSIPRRFWRTAVPSFRRCSAEPLHSGSLKYRDVVQPLHRPLHYRVRGWGCLKKKKKLLVIRNWPEWMKWICHTWSRGRHFSPSIPGDRYLNLSSKSDYRDEISANIVRYDALAPRLKVMRSISCLSSAIGLILFSASTSFVEWFS